jgi:D,D-heptose 1,7-bisphosphate phosphatase
MKIDEIVILVGGRGTRLGKITNKIPKPLITINKKPFLEYLFSKIIKYNFKTIYLLCSYKKEQFFKLYHKKKIHKSKIICIDEGNQKGTGGALFKLKSKIKKNFILINGDTFFDIDYKKIIETDIKTNFAKICLVDKKKSINNKIFTNLIIDKKNKIKFSNSNSKLMNGGVYLFNKKIFKLIKNRKLSLENDILEELIKKNKVIGQYFNSKFIDIGSKQKLFYLKKNENFLKNKCLFLDRDGVINKHDGYILNYKKFIFLPGVKKAINYANKKGFLVIVITNQSAIGRMWISDSGLNQIHHYMKKELFKYKETHIDDIFYSPYYKKSKLKKYRINKNDRKPDNGMIKKAVKKWNIDTRASLFIGDKDTDKQASEKSGLKFFFKKDDSLYKQLKKLI